MNKKVIVEILLNTRFNLDSEWGKLALSKEWIDYRIDIFMKYTALSLMNQSNQNFLTIVRYIGASEGLVLDAISKYKPLPENIVFVKESMANKIIENYVKDTDVFYIVRLDSDDMYVPNFIERLNEVEYYDNLQCIICQDGYVYDVLNNDLAIWHYPSPPFYTFVYNTSKYWKGERYKLEHGHEGAIKLKHEILPGLNFIFLVHDKNISSRFDNRINKIKIDDEREKETILRKICVPRYKD